MEILCSIYKQEAVSSNQTDVHLLINKILVNNNISCIYYYMKKFNFSSLYIQRAIDDNQKLLNEIKTTLSNPKTTTTSSYQLISSLYMRNLNYKYELLYNLSVILLFNKQPLQAFDCLIEILKSSNYNTNVYLWLRLAECAIQVYKQNDDVYKLSEKLKCVEKSISMHVYHKIVLASRLSKQATTISVNQIQNSEKSTLVFSYSCLKNAYDLSNKCRVDDKPSSKNDDDDESRCRDRFINRFQPSNGVSIKEFEKLKCSILVSLAYVSLCLYDYINTIKYCNVLLNDCKDFITKGHK